MADEPVTNNGSNDDKTEDSNEKSEFSPPRERRQSRPRHSGTQTRHGARNVRFRSRRKVCAFCADKVKVIEWKDLDMLRRFIGDDGSIRARRKTGTCAKHQRRLALAVKRARHMAMLPFTGEHVRLAGKS